MHCIMGHPLYSCEKGLGTKKERKENVHDIIPYGRFVVREREFRMNAPESFEPFLLLGGEKK